MTPAIYPVQSASTGITMKVLAVITFVVMSACLKAVSDRIPAGELAFFRSFFGIPPIVVWLVWKGDFPRGLHSQRPIGHIWRGLIGTTSMTLSFVALALLSLPEATAISYASPILAVVFSAILLGEKVRIIRVSAVVMGMIGVLIILMPDLLGMDRGPHEALGAMAALGGATFGALAQIQIRRMSGTESSSSIVFWFMLIASVLTLMTLPFGWVVPTRTELILLVGSGLLGGTAQLFMTTAYRSADASVLAPFDYTSMIFAVIIGYVFFAEIPTLPVIAGSGVVIAAGVLIIWRERQLGIERRRQRKVSTPHG